jgi:hypothetical protein
MDAEYQQLPQILKFSNFISLFEAGERLWQLKRGQGSGIRGQGEEVEEDYSTPWLRSVLRTFGEAQSSR